MHPTARQPREKSDLSQVKYLSTDFEVVVLRSHVTPGMTWRYGIGPGTICTEDMQQHALGVLHQNTLCLGRKTLVNLPT